MIKRTRIKATKGGNESFSSNSSAVAQSDNAFYKAVIVKQKQNESQEQEKRGKSVSLVIPQNDIVFDTSEDDADQAVDLEADDMKLESIIEDVGAFDTARTNQKLMANIKKREIEMSHHHDQHKHGSGTGVIKINTHISPHKEQSILVEEPENEEFTESEDEDSDHQDLELEAFNLYMKSLRTRKKSENHDMKKEKKRRKADDQGKNRHHSLGKCLSYRAVNMNREEILNTYNKANLTNPYSDSDQSSSSSSCSESKKMNYSDSSAEEDHVFPCDASDSVKLPSIERDVKYQKDFRSVELFKRLYRQSLMTQLKTVKLQFRNFKLQDEDLTGKFFHCNLYNDKNDQQFTRMYYNENFKVVYKDIQVIKTADIRSPIITTIYQLYDETQTKVLKIVKVMNILNPTTMRIQRRILVEEIDQFKAKYVSYAYRGQFIQKNNVIFFYRKQDEIYKLFRYDIQNDLLSEFQGESKRYHIPLFAGKFNLSIQFAQQFSQQKQKSRKLTKANTYDVLNHKKQAQENLKIEVQFVDLQYILVQDYVLRVGQRVFYKIFCMNKLVLGHEIMKKANKQNKLCLPRFTQFMMFTQEKNQTYNPDEKEHKDHGCSKITFVFIHQQDMYHWVYHKKQQKGLSDEIDAIAKIEEIEFKKNVLSMAVEDQHYIIEGEHIKTQNLTNVYQYFISLSDKTQNKMMLIYPVEYESPFNELEPDEVTQHLAEVEEHQKREAQVIKTIAQSRGLHPNWNDHQECTQLYYIFGKDHKKHDNSVYGIMTDLKYILIANKNEPVIFIDGIARQILIMLSRKDNQAIDIHIFYHYNQQVLQVKDEEPVEDGTSGINVDNPVIIDKLKKFSEIQQLIIKTIFDVNSNGENYQKFYINKKYAGLISGSAFVLPGNNTSNIKGDTFIRAETKYEVQENIIQKNFIQKSMFLELPNGNYKQITLYNDIKNLSLKHYQICSASYCFVFQYTHQNEYGEENNHKAVNVFVVKSHEEIVKMELKDVILSLDQICFIMASEQDNRVDPNDKHICHSMIKSGEFKKLISDIDNTISSEFIRVILTFENVIDMRLRPDFMVVYYFEEIQDHKHTSYRNRQVLVLNIVDLLIEKSQSMSTTYPDYIQEYHVVKKWQRNSSICRSSDIIEVVQHGKKLQQVKYQLMQKFMFDELEMYQATELFLSFYMPNAGVHGHNHSKLQIVGQKQIYESRQMSQDNQHCIFSINIPFYDIKHSVKGTHFIKVYQKEGERKKLKILALYDQDNNNLYKYRTKLVEFGFQRIFDIPYQQQTFYLVLCANIRSKNYNVDVPQFDNQESIQIIQKILEKIRSMKSIDFEFIIFSACFATLKKNFFFNSREIFFGKTMCDICLSDPVAIIDALKFDKKMLQQNSSSIIDDITLGYGEKTKNLIYKLNLKQDQMIICQDFNFSTQISRGFEIKCLSSVKLLINYLFREFNNPKYNDLLMLEWPQICKYGEIEMIGNFFYRRSIEKASTSQKDFCSIEYDINDPNLPVISDEGSDYIKFNEVQNYYNMEDELVNKIIDREKDKDKGNQVIEVEHKFIDFSFLIIGQKLRTLKCKNPYVLDDQSLSFLLLEPDKTGQDLFYTYEYAQKLIDMQFPFTQQYFLINFCIYIGGFFIPFMYYIAFVYYYREANDEVSKSAYFCLTLSFLTQLMFFVFEIFQCQCFGLTNYLAEVWNIIEITQFVLYFIYMCVKFSVDFQQDSIIEILILTVLTIEIFLKIMSFVRVFEQYGFLVKMITATFHDVNNFMVFFFMFVTFFAMVQIILHTEIDHDNEVYDHVPSFIKHFINAYRNSLGDVQDPVYSYWSDKFIYKTRQEILVPKLITNNDGSVSQVNISSTVEIEETNHSVGLVLFMIWFFWFMNQFTVCIILLNFLIAVISATYEEINSSKEMYSYKYKAQLNNESYTITKAFYPMNSFKFLILTHEKDVEDQDNDSFQKLSNLIKGHIETQIVDLKTKLKGDFNTQNTKINVVVEDVKQIKNDISFVKDGIKLMIDKQSDQDKKE